MKIFIFTVSKHIGGLEMRDLFEKPIVEWWRKFPVIAPHVEPKASAKKTIEDVLGNLDFPIEIAWELLKICAAAGFVEGDQEIFYDGSDISHVAEHLSEIPKTVKLSDLRSIRTNQPVDFSSFLENALKFFRRNQEIFIKFPQDNFTELYKYGVFRAESLYSLFGIEQMDLEAYLKYLSANLEWKRIVLGECFCESHRSSFVPIDHIEGKNVFENHSPFAELGTVDVKGMKKKIFLVFGPGFGEGCSGLRLSLSIEHPSATVFDVEVEMQSMGHEGAFHPTIVKIQRSPYQLDKALNYNPGFVPHGEFPSTGMQTAVQEAIGGQLFQGDVFYTLIMAFATLCSNLGHPFLLGYPGEKNKWLLFHDSRPGAGEEIYNSKYRMLGFRPNGRHWSVGLNGEYSQMLERALQYNELEQRCCIKMPKNQEAGNSQLVTVSLPQYRQRVSEAGLMLVLNAIYSTLPHLEEFTCCRPFGPEIKVFRTARIQDRAIEYERARIIEEALNHSRKPRKKK